MNILNIARVKMILFVVGTFQFLLSIVSLATFATGLGVVFSKISFFLAYGFFFVCASFVLVTIAWLAEKINGVTVESIFKREATKGNFLSWVIWTLIFGLAGYGFTLLGCYLANVVLGESVIGGLIDYVFAGLISVLLTVVFSFVVYPIRRLQVACLSGEHKKKHKK